MTVFYYILALTICAICKSILFFSALSFLGTLYIRAYVVTTPKLASLKHGLKLFKREPKTTKPETRNKGPTPSKSPKKAVIGVFYVILSKATALSILKIKQNPNPCEQGTLLF